MSVEFISTKSGDDSEPDTLALTPSRGGPAVYIYFSVHCYTFARWSELVAEMDGHDYNTSFVLPLNGGEGFKVSIDEDGSVLMERRDVRIEGISRRAMTVFLGNVRDYTAKEEASETIKGLEARLAEIDSERKAILEMVASAKHETAAAEKRIVI